MTRLILMLSLFFVTTASAHAQVIAVKSGEHDGFTRLVLELGHPRQWTLGRTLDGYGLRLSGPAQRFDLSKAFSLIDRKRLASIWVDPESNDLLFGLGCACHAIPFEFRPDVLVIDIRDGAASKGSSFEQALDGGTLPETCGSRNASAPAQTK